MTDPQHASPSTWFDAPNPHPKRRRPMGELLVELAERNGDPIWEASPIEGGRNTHNRAAS